MMQLSGGTYTDILTNKSVQYITFSTSLQQAAELEKILKDTDIKNQCDFFIEKEHELKITAESDSLIKTILHFFQELNILTKKHDFSKEIRLQYKKFLGITTEKKFEITLTRKSLQSPENKFKILDIYNFLNHNTSPFGFKTEGFQSVQLQGPHDALEKMIKTFKKQKLILHPHCFSLEKIAPTDQSLVILDPTLPNDSFVNVHGIYQYIKENVPDKNIAFTFNPKKITLYSTDSEFLKQFGHLLLEKKLLGNDQNCVSSIKKNSSVSHKLSIKSVPNHPDYVNIPSIDLFLKNSSASLSFKSKKLSVLCDITAEEIELDKIFEFLRCAKEQSYLNIDMLPRDQKNILTLLKSESLSITDFYELIVGAIRETRITVDLNKCSIYYVLEVAGLLQEMDLFLKTMKSKWFIGSEKSYTPKETSQNNIYQLTFKANLGERKLPNLQKIYTLLLKKEKIFNELITAKEKSGFFPELFIKKIFEITPRETFNHNLGNMELFAKILTVLKRNPAALKKTSTMPDLPNPFLNFFPKTNIGKKIEKSSSFSEHAPIIPSPEHLRFFKEKFGTLEAQKTIRLVISALRQKNPWIWNLLMPKANNTLDSLILIAKHTSINLSEKKLKKLIQTVNDANNKPLDDLLLRIIKHVAPGLSEKELQQIVSKIVKNTDRTQLPLHFLKTCNHYLK